MNSTFKFGSEEVCVCIKNQEVWFAAAAVTKILGYRNPSQTLSDNVSPKYICEIDLRRRGSKPKFISEPGLYQLIMRSQLPAAQHFQEWVLEEVLPSIRRNGRYQGEMPLGELGQLFDNLPALIQQPPNPAFKLGQIIKLSQNGDREAKILMLLANHAAIRYLDRECEHDIIKLAEVVA
ncbi:BRO family protein [Kamptonema sp. UHCC 0994]|uniref:BRO-N domain-containing protein n=1 Tax=Kamptonema sp. UHCC 0994 TaxID=3031329 RepID=UPI0023B9364D|nr:BRO family protein [Kamptonema sp. UHCC 0994]MDF0554895.1 BRO family protein [Kamptonema sp. UHCC 0994]